jgi:hypothetical protein
LSAVAAAALRGTRGQTRQQPVRFGLSLQEQIRAARKTLFRHAMGWAEAANKKGIGRALWKTGPTADPIPIPERVLKTDTDAFRRLRLIPRSARIAGADSASEMNCILEFRKCQNEYCPTRSVNQVVFDMPALKGVRGSSSASCCGRLGADRHDRSPCSRTKSADAKGDPP